MAPGNYSNRNCRGEMRKKLNQFGEYYLRKNIDLRKRKSWEKRNNCKSYADLGNKTSENSEHSFVENNLECLEKIHSRYFQILFDAADIKVQQNDFAFPTTNMIESRKLINSKINKPFRQFFELPSMQFVSSYPYTSCSGTRP